MNRGRLHLAAALLFTFAASANALMVDYAGGTFLGNGDDIAFRADLGGSFTFYGSPMSSIWASTNGNLNSTGYTAFTNQPFPMWLPMITTWWDDLNPTGADQGIFQNSAAAYDALTWNTNYYSGAGLLTFQAILVRNDTRIEGVNLLAGDIVFDYDSLGSSPGSATVGVNSADTLHYTYAVGTTDDMTTRSQMQLWSSNRSYYLFRYDSASGNYVASRGAAPVPEPATFTLLSFGVLAAIRRRHSY
jgi:hypothetical protein